jgi:hypothetical protein
MLTERGLPALSIVGLKSGGGGGLSLGWRRFKPTVRNRPNLLGMRAVRLPRPSQPSSSRREPETSYPRRCVTYATRGHAGNRGQHPITARRRIDRAATRESQTANRPVGEYAGLVAGSIGGALVNRLVHDPITARTNPLCKASIRSFGTSWNACALDPEGAAVDPADRGLGAGGEGKYCDRKKKAHFGLRKTLRWRHPFSRSRRITP